MHKQGEANTCEGRVKKIPQLAGSTVDMEGKTGWLQQWDACCALGLGYDGGFSVDGVF